MFGDQSPLDEAIHKTRHLAAKQNEKFGDSGEKFRHEYVRKSARSSLLAIAALIFFVILLGLSLLGYFREAMAVGFLCVFIWAWMKFKKLRNEDRNRDDAVKKQTRDGVAEE